MNEKVATWIVVADGCGARIFEERQRLGRLVERSDLAAVSHEDRKKGSAAPGTVTDRFGHGRHATKTSDPADRAERRFLIDVAKGIDAAAISNAFERLVIMAPPDALGVLRAELAPETLRRIEACDPHERHEDDAECLRGRLRALRANA